MGGARGGTRGGTRGGRGAARRAVAAEYDPTPLLQEHDVVRWLRCPPLISEGGRPSDSISSHGSRGSVATIPSGAMSSGGATDDESAVL